MSRIFLRILGLTGGNRIKIPKFYISFIQSSRIIFPLLEVSRPAVYVLFIPSDSDSFVTSDGLTFMVEG